jgi:hypothetical protein
MMKAQHVKPGPRTASRWVAVSVALAVLAVLAGLLLTATAGHAGPAVPGAACTTPGAVGVHGGQTYVCVQRSGETCPHWHWRYSPAVTPGWSRRPVGPCLVCSPTPVVSPSPALSPSSTVPPAGTPTTTPAAAGPLPVTG